MFVYLVTEKFKRGFAQDVFLAINNHDIVVEDLKDSFKVFEMLFGVFKGNQDVVDLDECVRDVAEYFVHKALKVLPGISLKSQMECAETGTIRTEL